VNATPVFYNAAILHYPTLQDLRMLGVRYLITPMDHPPPMPASPIAHAGSYALWKMRGAEPLVSFVHRLRVAPDGAAALRAVTASSFDPGADQAVVQTKGIPYARGPQPKIAVDRRSPEAISVTVTTAAPGLLVVRNSFDPDWSYSIEGGPRHQVLAADYFLQGVRVPIGTHTIVLTYEDSKIGQGLLVSAVVWGVFGLALAAAFVVGRRLRSRSTAGPPD
jgi:hypothetical protein